MECTMGYRRTIKIGNFVQYLFSKWEMLANGASSLFLDLATFPIWEKVLNWHDAIPVAPNTYQLLSSRNKV